MSHANLSPSARHRWGKCPASVAACAAYPPEKSGPAAIDGTHSHTLLEKCINDHLNAEDFIGQTLTDHEGEFVVDKERAERVQIALDYIDTREGTVTAEQKVNPKLLLGRDDMTGTVDVTIADVEGGVIELIDYKDGMGTVKSMDNPQLEQYGFGVLAPYYANGGTNPFKVIRMTIVQPKMCLKGQTGVSTYELPMGEFIAKHTQLTAEANATDAKDAPFVPGEEQCKYCRHKGACAAMASQAMEAAGINFTNLNVAKDAADKDPTSMSDAQIKEILQAAPLIRQMIEGCEAEALKRFEAGKTIEGLKLVRGRGSRAWSLTEDEIAEKLKKMGVPKTEVWQTKLISPAQAEKVTWTKRNGDKVQLTDRQLKILQTEYIKKSDGKLTVVSEADERQAVTISAAQMFGPVAEPALPAFLTLPSFLI